MSHHEYFQLNNRRFRNPSFRTKMTAEFPILPFVSRSFTYKRIRYFQQLIPDYCYFRRTLSLSADEMCKIFHISERSVNYLVKQLKSEVTKFQPRRFSDSGVRWAFNSCISRLRTDLQKSGLQKGEVLTLNELRSKCPILHEFIVGKRINIMIMEQHLPEIKFKFQLGEVVGVSLMGRFV